MNILRHRDIQPRLVSHLRLRIKGWMRFMFYALIMMLTALSLIAGQSQLSMARPRLGDLLFQGIQLMQIASISDSQEVSLGQQINQELLQQKQIRLYPDKKVSNYINQVGQRLAIKSARPNLPYTFQVVEDKAINAFATMGGYVYVNTGLIELAGNEAELASVISHEIGHIAARHAIKQMRQAALAQGLTNVAGLDRSVVVKLGTEVVVKRRSSRQHELEADQLGLNTLVRAGYAPGAMLDFFNKLISLGKGTNVPTFLSTHPSTPDRITALQGSINPTTAYNGDGLNAQGYKSSILPL